jgi:hypothetical protein
VKNYTIVFVFCFARIVIFIFSFFFVFCLYFRCLRSSIFCSDPFFFLERQKFTTMDCVVEEKWYHCWNIMIYQSFSIID